MRFIFPILLCLSVLLGTALPAFSQDDRQNRVPWHTPRVSFTWQQSNVRDVLKDFAVAQQLVLSISDSVKGVVSGTFEDVPAEKFLNSLCEALDLVWFYDGVRMHIESSSQIVSRPLSLAYATPEMINSALFSVGYASGPKGREAVVKERYRAGVILLVGGPQFVQATETLARDLDAQEGRRQVEQITVKTFRLSYATASDVSLTSGSSSRVIPGVVRTLQNLMANQQPGAFLSTGAEDTVGRRSHQGLMGQGLAAIGNSVSNQQRIRNPSAPDDGQQRPRSGSRDNSQQSDANDPRAPMIVADVRLNAVIVRDVAARMPIYENLIRMLDVPTKSIEISAAIVDIDNNKSKDVGLELLGFGKKDGNIGRIGFNADRGLFDGVDTQGQTASFIDGANLARGAGLNVTALLSGAGYDLLTRLRLIEKSGAGQVLSSPSVLTMENVQAVMRTDEKVYVRVPGSYTTDLFDVTTGVQLRVTPTIVARSGRTEFKLDIEIVDGSFSDQKVDTIPTTFESSITTQAMVPESRTLLLGGYTVERRGRTDSKVPYLSKVPIIGKLLSQNSATHERRQRFFLITPRLVNVIKEATSPTQYVPPDGNPIELKPSLPEVDLSRADPEDLARGFAASTARVLTEDVPMGTPAPTPPPTKRTTPEEAKTPSTPPKSSDKAVKPAASNVKPTTTPRPSVYIRR